MASEAVANLVEYLLVPEDVPYKAERKRNSTVLEV